MYAVKNRSDIFKFLFKLAKYSYSVYLVYYSITILSIVTAVTIVIGLVTFSIFKFVLFV